jgi:protein farnesyltransferase/geranylgeranyltransferase type-1 subunit alpha
LLSTLLKKDTKNYHAWSYRIWLISTFPLLAKQDLENIDEMITEDVYNNSAWNQRFFLVDAKETGVEVGWVIERIRMAPRNEAAWNYLKGYAH